ncbi:uncharacterized protein LOC111832145 [Capsella rubella]|uniref:uncharacterized protein LOC111832145 n=1 Tax=Capsella rubella TaxID=81985 RepID=UPI000CD4E401|nr:uncharacterized protein LOC111832145 [Capsella rubella]
MSFRWNSDVLLCRRFVSGAFTRCRCFFRLITGDCPLIRGYGGLTWVFDPGINGGINGLDGIIIRDRISEIVWFALNGLIRIVRMLKKKKWDGFFQRQRYDRRFVHIFLSFRQQESESFQTTFLFFISTKVMRKEFWSFFYKMIANYEYVKGGRNIFYLFACKASNRKARSCLLLYQNCIQFPLFMSMVVYEWFMYHVKLFII